MSLTKSKLFGIILAIPMIMALLSGVIACGSSADPNKIANNPLTVLSTTGGIVSVQKSGSGNWVSAREGLTLAKGDKIKTDAGGKAVITFFDGSVIELNDNTAVSLDELTAKSASSPKTIKIGQTIGETTSTVVKLVDPASKYEINTPSAVAGVRGTIMQVAVAANGSTSVANVEGSVSVTAQGKEVNVPPIII